MSKFTESCRMRWNGYRPDGLVALVRETVLVLLLGSGAPRRVEIRDKHGRKWVKFV